METPRGLDGEETSGGGRGEGLKATMSRLGTPPPPSKLQLLQEYYAHDAWMLPIAWRSCLECERRASTQASPIF